MMNLHLKIGTSTRFLIIIFYIYPLTKYFEFAENCIIRTYNIENIRTVYNEIHNQRFINEFNIIRVYKIYRIPDHS